MSRPKCNGTPGKPGVIVQPSVTNPGFVRRDPCTGCEACHKQTGPEELRAEAEGLARYGKIEQWHHAKFSDLADEWERERTVPAEVREAAKHMLLLTDDPLDPVDAAINSMARFIQQLDGKGGAADGGGSTWPLPRMAVRSDEPPSQPDQTDGKGGDDGEA